MICKVILLFVIGSTMQQFIDLENSHFPLAIQDPKELLAQYLNTLYGTNEGNNILQYCTSTAVPEPKDVDTFLKQCQKVTDSTKSVITKKLYPQITGKSCTYNQADPNEFISAKKAKADVGTKAVLQDLMKTQFGKISFYFTKYAGEDMLGKIIPDKDYIKELLYFFDKEDNIGKLFESFCSINNIFSFTQKKSENLKDSAELIKGFILSVKPHWEKIK